MYNLTIESPNLEDFKTKIISIAALLGGAVPAPALNTKTMEAVVETGAVPPISNGNEGHTPNAAPAPATTMTAADLIAGMTLKPTGSTGLGDGTKVSNGDYVMHSGEPWHIVQTYRGALVAVNENGTANILKTDDATAYTREPPAQPARAGTAAAHGLGSPAVAPQEPTAGQLGRAPVGSTDTSPDAPITTAEATLLREMATAKVSGQMVAVEKVFDKLEQLQASTIDALTVTTGAMFREWIEAVGKEPPPADKKFGF